MQTSSQGGKHIKAVAFAGAFLCGALMLSLAESILFPTGILPIPGAKLGLANGAVLLCATLMGRRYAATVSIARVLLMFFLFGSGTSILYSLSGAALSLVGIIIFCNSKSLSFFGKSIIAAILHNMAQAACAIAIFGFPAAALIPWMILAAVLSGGVTGIILNLSYTPVSRSFYKLYPNTKP